MGDGAGFLNSPGNFGTQTNSQRERKDKLVKNDNVVSCTVAHLLETTTERATIGSLSVSNLSVVGLVRSIDEQSTRIIYTIDDMTGPPIEVQFWMGDGESDRGTDQRSRVVEGGYIRVIGSLRTIQEKKLILAYKVVPLTDLNDLSMHLLEIIHTNMAIALMDNKQTQQVDNKVNNATFDNNTSTTTPAPVENAAMYGLNPQQKKVFQVLLGATTDEGMHIDTVCDTLSSMRRSEVRLVIDFLCNEGHIYSTTDDDHFKATDSV